jgi:ligand-binding sensor domain-containing protein
VRKYNGTNFDLVYTTDDGLISNGVNGIAEDAENNLWFSTS